MYTSFVLGATAMASRATVSNVSRDFGATTVDTSISPASEYALDWSSSTREAINEIDLCAVSASLNLAVHTSANTCWWRIRIPEDRPQAYRGVANVAQPSRQVP